MIASGVLLLEGTVVKEAVDWLEKAQSLLLCQIQGRAPERRTTIATIVMKLVVNQSARYVCTPYVPQEKWVSGMHSKY